MLTNREGCEEPFGNPLGLASMDRARRCTGAARHRGDDQHHVRFRRSHSASPRSTRLISGREAQVVASTSAQRKVAVTGSLRMHCRNGGSCRPRLSGSTTTAVLVAVDHRRMHEGQEARGGRGSCGLFADSQVLCEATSRLSTWALIRAMVFGVMRRDAASGGVETPSCEASIC